MSTQQLQQALEKFGTKFEQFHSDYSRRLGQIEADLEMVRLPMNAPEDRGIRIPPEFGDEVRALGKGKQMAVTVGTDAEGGHAAPEILRGIETTARRVSPLLDLVRVERSDSGQYKHVVTDDAASSGWIGEGGSRDLTTTPTFHGVQPTGGFVYSYVRISEEALDDLSFDIGNFLIDEAGRAIGKQIGSAIVSGNGTNKPTGFLNGTPSGSGDEASPARTFGVPQYFPTGAAADFQSDVLSQSSPPGDPAGVLFDALYGLNSEYRANATWTMNSTTLAKIRKFRDANGNHLFIPGLVSGMDGELLGRPVRICEDMPDTGSNAFPVAVADWMRAYLVVMVQGVRITTDANITVPGQIHFYVRQRLLGKMMQSDAVKLVKCATS